MLRVTSRERAPTADELRAAHAVVAERLAPTPLVAAPGLGADVWLKLETAQPTGAFKVRGALAALAVGEAGLIVTASAGNHALAVAWAARELDRRAVVVVPENASPAKLAGLDRLGADVRRHGSSFDEAEAHALELAASSGAGEYLSAYDDTVLFAGQATLGAELEDLGEPLTVVCPVGGGGLLSGLCAWAAGRPGVRLVGVEAAASRAVSTAIRAGRVVTVEVGPTLADGLAGNIAPGAVTWEIIGGRADDLVAVSEEEIAAAMRALAADHGLVAEGAGAAATAAVLAGHVPAGGERVVVLVTGRNVALPALAAVLQA
jgi:threonine dehydratase